MVVYLFIIAWYIPHDPHDFLPMVCIWSIVRITSLE